MTMKKGKLLEWYDEKGYGFIAMKENREKVFVHISDISSNRRPRVGDTLYFELEKGENGKDKATRVRLRTRIGLIYLVIISLPFIGSLFIFKVTVIPFFAYLVMGVISFFFYFEDKHHARMSRVRRSERVLHLLELSGGWPGALLAQQLIRHKNKKRSYQIMFWGIVSLHLFFWAALFVFTSIP